MKAVMFFPVTLAAVLFAFHQPDHKANIQQNKTSELIKPDACLAQKDGEKILGQTAILTENSSENNNGITTFRCTYTAEVIVPKTKKTSNLYYLLEVYKKCGFLEKIV